MCGLGRHSVCDDEPDAGAVLRNTLVGDFQHKPDILQSFLSDWTVVTEDQHPATEAIERLRNKRDEPAASTQPSLTRINRRQASGSEKIRRSKLPARWLERCCLNRRDR